MKKVLFTASTESHIRNFHLPYLVQWQKQGWEVHVACGSQEGEIPGADRRISFPLQKRMLSLKNLRAAAQLRRTIRQERYDLLLCHTSLAAFFSRLALLGMPGRPAVCNVVHGYLFDDESSRPKRWLLTAAEKLCAPVTDRIVTMNGYDREYARRHRLAKQVDFVHGLGLDPERYSAVPADAGKALRQQLGFDDEDFLLLYGAEFSPRKSQQVLLEALPLLPERVKLLLPGSGELLEECRMLAHRRGLAQRVCFPGQVRDMGPWYLAADAAVSASRSEGLPFNILEAMYHALPVVASDVKGHRDLLADGVNGLLYPYGDRVVLGEKIQALICDPEWAAGLGTAARENAQNYCLPTVLPELMACYWGCLRGE